MTCAGSNVKTGSVSVLEVSLFSFNEPLGTCELLICGSRQESGWSDGEVGVVATGRGPGKAADPRQVLAVLVMVDSAGLVDTVGFASLVFLAGLVGLGG